MPQNFCISFRFDDGNDWHIKLRTLQSVYRQIVC